ncbi:MAG: CHASE2 domain-containing protein, partial [bacterium]
TRSVPVAIVAMDQNSLKEIGVWPSPRGYYADVFRKISESGATAILVDFNFASPSSSSADDRKLVETVREIGKVVLPVQMETRETPEGALIRNVTLPFLDLEESAMALGGITLTLDHDDVVRRMPSSIELGYKTYLPLGVVGAKLIDPDLSTDIPKGALIDMAYATLRMISVVPFINVLRDDFDPGLFRNKVVLVGATSEDLHDFWMTSIGVIPGVYIQAAVLETALNKSWYVRQEKRSAALVVLAASLILGLLMGRTGWRGGALILLVFYAAIALVSALLFRNSFVIDAVPLILVGAIQLPVQVGLHARMTEQVLDFERRKTSAILKLSDFREAEEIDQDVYTVPLVLLRQALKLNRISLYLLEERDPLRWREEAVVGEGQTATDEDMLAQTIEGGEFIRVKRGKAQGSSVYIPLMTIRKAVGVLYAEGTTSFKGSDVDIGLLLSYATNTAYFLESRELDERVKSLYVNTIKAISKALDSKDHYTSAHSELSLDYVEKFGKACGLKKDQIEVLHVGALLHDIGKIGVPDEILTKSEKLTEAEFEKMMKHSLIGYEIVKDLPFPEEVKLIVRNHHERFDGLGYPDGLKGEEIDYVVRIFSVIDVFQTLIGSRPYKQPMDREEAKSEIKRCAGTQFDPELVRVFLPLV